MSLILRFLYSDVCFSFFYLIISLSFCFPVYLYFISVSFVMMSILFLLKHVSNASSVFLTLSIFFFSNLFSPSLYFSVPYELSPEKRGKNHVFRAFYTPGPTLSCFFFFSGSRLYRFHFSNVETPEKLWSVSRSYIMM